MLVCADCVLICAVVFCGGFGAVALVCGIGAVALVLASALL